MSPADFACADVLQFGLILYLVYRVTQLEKRLDAAAQPAPQEKEPK